MNTAIAEELPPAEGRVVLYRGQSGFTVADVLAVSWFLGELRAPWRELLEALACQERAGELDLEADDGALTEMSEEFRYDRELLTVEEIERWLTARDLTEDDFNGYLVRRYWQAQPPEPVEEQEADYLEAAPQLRELLRAELLFSGRFDRLAQAASWRLAARPEGSNKTAESVDDERARFFERTGLDEGALPAALKHLNRTAEWFEECLQMEICYRRVCDSLVTDEARARTLAALRLPLTRINIQTLHLRSKNAAQEAVLCLRENRLAPEELAKECGASWEEQEVFLGDCGADAQQDLLSAAAGEVLGPRPCDDGFLVARIENKTEPNLRDDEIRGRIDRRLLESHFSEICSRNIRWVWGDWAR